MQDPDTARRLDDCLRRVAKLEAANEALVRVLHERLATIEQEHARYVVALDAMSSKLHELKHYCYSIQLPNI